MMRQVYQVGFFLLLMAGLGACYKMRPSSGGAQTAPQAERGINVADIALPAGYQIEPVATNLTFPTGVTFDENGQVYVIEAGYSYGEVWKEPRLLYVGFDGKIEVVVTGGKNGPWNGVYYHDGHFYIAEGGQLEGGKILKIDRSGNITPLVSNLPSFGDHHTNAPVVKDGYVYFGQGTATNAGVVGNDNAHYGWLKRKQDFHDIPCQDITLAGKNYETGNVLTEQADDKAVTGAFSPYNTPSTAAQVVRGSLPCSGAIMRVPVNGGNLELVAWGLRNPFGMALSPYNTLFVTENGYDERGSRPVWGVGDVLWEVKPGTWYGWPDFSGGRPISGDEEFKSPSHKPVEPLLSRYPNTPPKPVAVFGVHSSSNGLDFSRNAAFGHAGQAFVAQFGDLAPEVGKVLSPVGFKVVRVDVSSGVIEDFATNKGNRNGPATWLNRNGLERPIAVRFNPAGDALYVVDFGIIRTTEHGMMPQEKTGILWKITRQAK